MFEKNVQGKHRVGYWQCSRCRSLQTDRPTWLDAAYRDFPGYGVDGAHRASAMRSRVLFAATLFGLGNALRVLDWGGGCGLVARMLRDVGFDAYVCDPFAPNLYAMGYDGDPNGTWDIVTAFEVLEHLPDPRRDIAPLFASRPRLIIACTWPYHDEGEGWPYLHHESGQHVFFWSEAALAEAGRDYGYDSFVDMNFIVYSREPITHAQRALLRFHYALSPLLSGAIPLVFRDNLFALRDEYQHRGIAHDAPRISGLGRLFGWRR
jgi:hypothetical protein